MGDVVLGSFGSLVLLCRGDDVLARAPLTGEPEAHVCHSGIHIWTPDTGALPEAFTKATSVEFQALEKDEVISLGSGPASVAHYSSGDADKRLSFRFALKQAPSRELLLRLAGLRRRRFYWAASTGRFFADRLDAMLTLVTSAVQALLASGIARQHLSLSGQHAGRGLGFKADDLLERFDQTRQGLQAAAQRRPKQWFRIEIHAVRNDAPSFFEIAAAHQVLDGFPLSFRESAQVGIAQVSICEDAAFVRYFDRWGESAAYARSAEEGPAGDFIESTPYSAYSTSRLFRYRKIRKSRQILPANESRTAFERFLVDGALTLDGLDSRTANDRNAGFPLVARQED